MSFARRSEDILYESEQNKKEEKKDLYLNSNPISKQTSARKTTANPISNVKHEVPTLLRIKRKNFSAPEKEESFEKILNFCVMKKMKFTPENTKVFTFFKTIGRENITIRPSAAADVRKLNLFENDGPVGDEGTALAREPHRAPIKKGFNQQASMAQVKQILSSKMVQKAKDTRYRLRDEKRKQQIVQDGIMYNVVDIEKDDGIDPLTRSLEAMTHEFLNLNSSESQLQKDSDEEDMLYDLYIYNQNAPLADVLNSGFVGTLEMDDDTLYLEDEATASDIGSDSDSNAEDYYKNDYPEDELSDEGNIYPSIYASSHEISESESDFY